MFHSALWKLTRLRWRGAFRQFGRSLKTVRGLVQFGFMLAMVGWGAGSMLFVGIMSASAQNSAVVAINPMAEFAAFGLFMLTTYTLLFSTGDTAVYFTAGEIAFLFPAPFHRRQLLTYKLLQSLMGLTLLSLIMSVMFARSPGLWLSGFIGLILTLTFIQLLTMNVAFLRQVLEARTNAWLRRVIGYGILVLLLAAATQMVMTVPEANPVALAKAFRSSTAGSWLLAPFDVFARMIFPRDAFTFLTSTGTVLLLDLCLLATAYRMDGFSLEAALVISEKVTARMRQLQTKGVWQVIGSQNSQVAQRRLPRLPFWYGIGPIVWQRVTTNIRTSMKIFAILGGAVLVAAGFAFSIHLKNPTEPFAAAGAAMGVMTYVSFLICLSLQNEIERVGYLKSLPLRPTAIVLGELLGFVVLLSAVQGAFFLALCGLLPSISGWLVCAAVVALPLNFLLFAIDKVVFYFFPTRLVKGAPGDFQNAGKQMLFAFLKTICLVGGLALVGVSTIPGILLGSPLLAVIPAVIVLLAECASMVPLLTLAFSRFDPSVDTPA